jgi:integrase
MAGDEQGLVPAPSARLEVVAPSAYPSDQNPVLVFLARLEPSGRRTQRAALETMARAVSGGALGADQLPWHLLRYPHTAALRSWLQGRYQPGTANTYLSALRGVVKECWRLELMPTDDYMRARDVEAVRGSTLPRGRELSGGEVRALFEVLARDPRPIARRDACVLALLVGAGVRRTELVQLQLADVDLEAGRVLIRRGKGRKERVSWIPPSALPAIQDWIHVRGVGEGPLLKPIRKGGEVQDRSLSAQAVRDICQSLARNAATRPFSPHDGRRTWIGDLLDATGDISIAQQLAGHASPVTTARYDRRPEATRRRAASQLHVPYVPPTRG